MRSLKMNRTFTYLWRILKARNSITLSNPCKKKMASHIYYQNQKSRILFAKLLKVSITCKKEV